METPCPLFKVRNFDRYQHYKRKNPPWVKVYFRIWQDRHFCRFTDQSKLLALAVVSLASQYDNELPLDPEWIQAVCHLTSPPNFAQLIESGFILGVSDSDKLALQQYLTLEVARRDSTNATNSKQARTRKAPEERQNPEAENSSFSANQLQNHNLSAQHPKNSTPETETDNSEKDLSLSRRAQQAALHTHASELFNGCSPARFELNFAFREVSSFFGLNM